jgi:hypothetical protein
MVGRGGVARVGSSWLGSAATATCERVGARWWMEVAESDAALPPCRAVSLALGDGIRILVTCGFYIPWIRVRVYFCIHSLNSYKIGVEFHFSSADASKTQKNQNSKKPIS